MDGFGTPPLGAAQPCDPLQRPALTQPPVDTVDFADFSEFYREFTPVLIVFLVWQGARLAVAANIAQQTMLTAYQHWSETDHPARCARTAASRKLARHIASIDEDYVGQLPKHRPLLPASLDVKTWEHRHQILTALKNLSPRQRQVMAWALGGYTPAEIAGELHITFPGIRAILIKARGAFAAHLSTGQTTSGADCHPEQKTDHWLIEQHHTLVIDVVDVLEIEEGLREVLTPIHHADLDRCLDGTAGLAAPVAPDSTAPTARIPNPGLTAAENSPAGSSEEVSSEPATPNAILLKFLQAAASWNLSMRLTVRTHPIFGLTEFHDRVHTLVRNLDAVDDFALVLSRALDCILRRTLDRALARDLDLSGDLDQALDHELDLAREIARNLDHHLDLARGLARGLARDLAHHLTHIRDLALLPPLDLDYALDQILKLPQTSNYTRLSARSLARDLARVGTLIDDFHRVGSFAHELAQTIQALLHLHHVLSDVTGLDLRHTDLAGIPLEGLRWSAETRWPPQIEHQIRRNSIKIADEIFEIGPDTTTDHPAKA